MPTGNRPAFLSRFFSTPPTRNDRIRMQELCDDPQLPHGKVASFVDVLNDKHWEVTLLGRVVSIVDQLDKRYLILEALPSRELLNDFKELVWALGRLQERTCGQNAKSIDSWTRPGRDDLHSGHIYVHLTSPTRMATHAWQRDELWLTEPTLIEPALSTVQTVDPSSLALSSSAWLTYSASTTQQEEQQYVLKCRFLARLHLPTVGATLQHPEMAVFFGRGWTGGRGCYNASEQLPVREDAQEP
ncbi:hypothetical protein C8F01DRAFT_1255757 [Mycena amicta]|nr:hypothetical protein C8F01DRAFT_1255757 [Mycena amicta]